MQCGKLAWPMLSRKSQLSGGKGQKPETGEYLNDETTMKAIEDAHKGVSTFENSGVS